MFRKNKYIFRSKVSENQFLRLLDFYCADFNASEISKFIGLSRNTVNKIMAALRVRIFELEEPLPFQGSFDVNSDLRAFESREKGTVAVLGVRLEHDNIKTTFFPQFPSLLFNGLHNRVFNKTGSKAPEDIHNFHLFIELQGSKRHVTINANLDTEIGVNRSKDITRFSSFFKMRMAKFRGAKPETLAYHCRETEFRYNHRFTNMFQVLAQDLGKHPLMIKESLLVYGSPMTVTSDFALVSLGE